MRIFASLLALALGLSSTGPARAEGEDDYKNYARTYSGTIGNENAVLELISSKESGTYLGRFSLIENGLDVPLHSAAENASERKNFVFREEAPCTPRICESVEAEDEEFGDLADGAPPIAADWTFSVSDDGKRIEGTRKERKTGKRQSLSFAYEGLRTIDYDCCRASDILMEGSDFGSETGEDSSYDRVRFSVGQIRGDEEYVVGEGRYRLALDGRIGSEMPVFLRLPGDGNIDAVNNWLQDRRIALYANDFACASRLYHGFRWDRKLAPVLKSYETRSSVSLEFLSHRLIAIEEHLIDRCHSDRSLEETYLMADTATGEDVKVGTLLKDFEFVDQFGAPIETVEGVGGAYHPNRDLIGRLIAAFPDFATGHGESCKPDDHMLQMTATIRSTDLVFDLPSFSRGDMECDSAKLSIPLKKAAKYLNEKGMDYLGEFLR